jgi:Na+-driven multidrug efflux pump
MRIFLPAKEYNIEAISTGARCLKILAFIQIPKAINIVFSSSLRAAGDVRWLLFASIVGTTIGEIILAQALGLGIVMTSGLVKFGLPGIWIGMLTGESIRGALNYRRYRQGAWKKIKV